MKHLDIYAGIEEVLLADRRESRLRKENREQGGATRHRKMEAYKKDKYRFQY